MRSVAIIQRPRYASLHRSNYRIYLCMQSAHYVKHKFIEYEEKSETDKKSWIHFDIYTGKSAFANEYLQRLFQTGNGSRAGHTSDVNHYSYELVNQFCSGWVLHLVMKLKSLRVARNGPPHPHSRCAVSLDATLRAFACRISRLPASRGF